MNETTKTVKIPKIFRQDLISSIPQSGFIDSEDAHIAYQWQPPLAFQDSTAVGKSRGSEKTSLLLLINGYQRPGSDFKMLCKRIQKDLPYFTTVSLDNQGAGQTSTSRTEPLTIFRMARDAWHTAQVFMEKLNITTFHVLGVSMGGMIAQQLAAQCAEVQKLILVSTGLGTKTVQDFPQDPLLLKQHLLNYFSTKSAERLKLQVDALVKNMITRQKQSTTTVQDADNQHNAVLAFQGRILAPSIYASTLIITGDEDRIMPPENSTKLQQALINAASVSVKHYPDAGHMLLMEEPEKLAHDICLFLKA